MTVLDQNGWSACARDGSTNVLRTGCGRKRIVLLLLCSVMNEFYSKIHILKGLHALVGFFHWVIDRMVMNLGDLWWIFVAFRGWR